MKKNKNKSQKLNSPELQKLLFSLLLLFFSITSCKMSGKEEKSADNLISVQNTSNGGESEYEVVKNVVQDWNKAHQDKDFTAMRKVYDDNVLYYGIQMVKEKIVTSKQSFIKKYSDFTQTILGDFDIQYISDHKIKVSFVKKASFGGNSKEYPSYLEVRKTDLGWRICTESDDITDKNLAKKSRNKVPQADATIKRTYLKNNNVFVLLGNNREKQLTFNGTDRKPIIINEKTVFFIRKQYDEDNNEEMLLMTVETNLLKENLIKTLDSYSCFDDPKLSNDKKHIYYLDCLYATNYGLIKLNVFTGESQHLLNGYWYHEIASGDFKDFFLIYTSGFEANREGRIFYLRLYNSKGELYKTFANETAMYNFAEANITGGTFKTFAAEAAKQNFSRANSNSSSKEITNTPTQNKTYSTAANSGSQSFVVQGKFSLKSFYVESKGWTTFKDDYNNSKVSIGTHNDKEFRAHKTFIEVQGKKILMSANNKIERVIRIKEALSAPKERTDSQGKYKFTLYEGTISVGEYGNEKTGTFELGTVFMDNSKHQYIKTFDGLDAIFIF